MAKLEFIGAAQAISQVDTITIGGTWAAGETVTIKVAEKSVTYTAETGDTASTVAAALKALCVASDEPEFTEITWTVDSAVITATSTEGVPVTITTSETAASGTSSLSNVTAATGPYHWDNDANWSTGSAPTTGDEVYFEDADVKALYGLPTSLTLAKLRCNLGQVGNPDRNPAGYPEYRATRAIITCTDVICGSGPGVGPTLVRLDLSTSAAVVAVYGSQQRGDIPAVDLLLNSSSASVSILSGQVGIAAKGDDTSTILTARVGAAGALLLGPGVTVTNVLSAGNTTIRCAVTTLTVDAGTTTLVGSSTVATLTVRGGTVVHKTSGTITAATVGPGTIDASQDLRPRTVTDMTLNKNGTLEDPYTSLTITNGVVLGGDADRLVAQ